MMTKNDKNDRIYILVLLFFWLSFILMIIYLAIEDWQLRQELLQYGRITEATIQHCTYGVRSCNVKPHSLCTVIYEFLTASGKKYVGKDVFECRKCLSVNI